MKFIICAAFAIALIATVNSSNSYWGSRTNADSLVFLENVVRSPLKNNYWNVDVRFPVNGQANNRTITAVFVYDRFTNSSGASNSLLSGGPGMRNALVNLKSQNNRGINSTVEIYGK